MTLVLIRLLVFVLAAFPFASRAQEFDPPKNVVSVVEILVSPEKFDGKTVSVKGWLTIRHEDTGLWATPNDYKKRNTKLCISLMNRYKDDAMNKAVDAKHVIVTGIFFKDISHDRNGQYVFRPDACSNFGIRFIEPLGLRQAEQNDAK
jgi:hypothetical protein